MTIGSINYHFVPLEHSKNNKSYLNNENQHQYHHDIYSYELSMSTSWSQFQDINNNKISLSRHQNILNDYHPSILQPTIQSYYPNKIKHSQYNIPYSFINNKKSSTTVSCHQKSFLSNDYQNKESIYPYSNINFVHNSEFYPYYSSHLPY